MTRQMIELNDIFYIIENEFGTDDFDKTITIGELINVFAYIQNYGFKHYQRKVLSRLCKKMKEKK